MADKFSLLTIRLSLSVLAKYEQILKEETFIITFQNLYLSTSGLPWECSSDRWTEDIEIYVAAWTLIKRTSWTLKWDAFVLDFGKPSWEIDRHFRTFPEMDYAAGKIFACGIKFLFVEEFFNRFVILAI